jgi:hypothetical protein
MTANFKHINASEQIFDGSITASLLAPTAAVLSIHADSNSNLTGAIQMVSGTHITLSQVGQAITINATGELSQALTNSHIFVGNASNVATDVAMTGDVSITNTGVTTVFGLTTKLSLTGGTLTGALGIGETPVASALLDVASTTQGFLPPRMTSTQRTAISSPAEGLQVYDLTVHQLYLWNGSSWTILG